jgi:hypothetical protein
MKAEDFEAFKAKVNEDKPDFAVIIILLLIFFRN